MKQTMGIGAWIASGLLLCGAAGAQATTGLEDFLRLAEEGHPRLEASRSQTATLAHQADLAGALPDLKLAWGEMIVPVETRVGPQHRVFSLSQNLPWFGTLGSASAAATLRRDAASAREQATRLEVRREVYRAYFEVARLQAEQNLVQGQMALLQQEEIAAEAAYETGGGPYSRLLRLQMNRQRLLTRRDSLEDALVPATAALEVAAGLPVGSAVTPRARLPLPAGSLPDREALAARVHEGNPTLAGLRLQEQGFGRDVQTARLQGKPGLTVGLDYIMTGEAAMPGTEDSGQDPIVARVAVSLPLWSGKSTARRQAAVGRQETAAAERRRLELELEQRLERALFRLRDAERRLNLLNDDLLPAAHQLEAAARADYESGRAGLAEFLAAGREILDLKTEILRHEADRALALVDLDILQGGEGDAYLAFPGE